MISYKNHFLAYEGDIYSYGSASHGLADTRGHQ